MSVSGGCTSRARRTIQRAQAIDVARFFTEDFRLEDPGAGVIRTGLDGAQRMMEALRGASP